MPPNWWDNVKRGTTGASAGPLGRHWWYGRMEVREATTWAPGSAARSVIYTTFCVSKAQVQHVKAVAL